MRKPGTVRHLTMIFMLAWGFSFLLPAAVCRATDAVCAEVKIEVAQDLTLERQAFDAHMRIHNGLSHICLEDVAVSVWFKDADGNPVLASSDPSDTSALFFIRVDSMTNIDDVDGSGAVPASTSADIHWLIIPAGGASNGLESGTLYHVGASLSYTIGGEENITEVSPDYIYVKPLPAITLDYFLTEDVYGDDAFTPETEAPVPFTLGVRVKNSGQGTTRGLKIESAQPRIIDNAQGLLIGFAIRESQVNGQAVSPSLLVDFGDIAPGGAGTGRWRLTCSLSGRFTDFDAHFSHSDELGGALTSLIDAADTHILVADVRVDLPGRDRVVDFLARDGDVYRVYESEGLDTEVDDQSGASSLTLLSAQADTVTYALATPPDAGFVFVRLADPHGGAKRVASAVRGDGKTVKEENFWLSKTRNGQGWDYFVNLFDVATGGQYTVVFADPGAQNHAPVLDAIGAVVAAEGEPVSVEVTASDPDATVPALSAASLPAGAAFIDRGDGTAILSWTPASGQAGSYRITFSASDGELSDSQAVDFTIRSITDSDGDGIDDAWELARFGTLDRDGSGDYDNDGISDLDEYRMGTDPLAADHAPTVPLILSPASGSAVADAAVQLEIENSTDADGDALFYQFEVFSDHRLTDPVAAAEAVDQTDGTTTWQITAQLAENQSYVWRVRAGDGYSFSLWAYGDFSVNAANEAPLVPTASYPADGSRVDSRTPVFEAVAVADPDGEVPECRFEIYADPDMAGLLAESDALAVSDLGRAVWTATGALTDGEAYFWRAVVTDAGGLSAETPLAAFTVDPANRAPCAPQIGSPAEAEHVTATTVELVVSNAIDADGDPLTYSFEIDTDPGFGSDQKQVSSPIQAGATTTAWTISGLADNTLFHWRARATDGMAPSRWVYGRFFVNTGNDSPLPPVAENPGQSAWVGVLTPVLCLATGADADGDDLTYSFEVYADPALTALVANAEAETFAWRVPTDLTDKTRYYWRARATDAHGLAGAWMETGAFFVSKEAVEVPEAVTVTVSTATGAPLSGLRVYAFTAAGAYTGLSAVTDADGTASFDTDDLDEGTYRFRADYLGIQFWFAAVSVPQTAAVALVIETRTVTVTVDSAAGVLSGVRVYLFSSSGAYLNRYLTTDANGAVHFDLPEGQTFTFRADVMGSQYWSGPVTVAAGQATLATVDAGGGTLTVDVLRDDQQPLSGIRVYLFDQTGASYRNLYATTDENGRVVFEVTRAGYRLRADYLGCNFWSEALAVETDTTEVIEIAHQTIRPTVVGRFDASDTPVCGIKAYLFSSSGAYLNLNATTDENGRVEFDLPEKEFMIRADYFGGQYWSQPFTWEDPLIAIALGDARVAVTGAGLPAAGVKVYVFSATGAYLNLNATTDESGEAVFRLPEGTYRFRADYQGASFWAPDRTIAADALTDVAISAGGGTFALSVLTGDQRPIAGVKCYVFNQAGAYLNLCGATDENGGVSFDLADGTYRFRVDHCGHPFWSEAVAVSGNGDHTMTIAHAAVQVALTAAGDPVCGATVYLFSTADAYLGIRVATDADGLAVFDLPMGMDVRFRADVLGAPFWSADACVADGAGQVPIDAGGGRMQVTVETDAGVPLEGLKVYLFGENGQYLNLSGQSDAAGRVAFDVPEGVYRVRADYLGYFFWKEAIEVASDLDVSLVIPMEAVTVTVAGNYQSADTPLSGVKVYLFSPTGAYLNLNAETDALGQVVFDLPERAYTVRADYTGGRYWSDPFTGQDATVSIPMADAAVTVTGAGLPAAGVPVYLFSAEDAYLGRVQATDAGGSVGFRVPAGDFKFRADYQGSHYWSAVTTLAADVENAVLIGVGGGRFALDVKEGDGAPMAGIGCNVFSEAGAYLNLRGSTDDNGRVCFDLADGTFRFRADYLGYPFWSDAVAVPGTLEQTVAIDHGDVTVTFQADYLGAIQPLEGRRVYLFNPAGAYLGRYLDTDAAGRAVFSLPDQPYKFRCDELGQHYWSPDVQGAAAAVTVYRGKAVIHVSMAAAPAPNARVYLFSAADSYLGRYENTDADGRIEFVLPAGQYRFRADLDGRQQWTAVVAIDAGEEEALTVDLD